MSERTPDFLSGTSGQVWGIRTSARAVLADALDAAIRYGRIEPARLRRASRTLPARQVLVLGIERTDMPNLIGSAQRELQRSRHRVDIHFAPAGNRGKFENLNALLAAHPVEGYDWLLVVDDDVVLPHGFLDNFLFLAERFNLELAQPAHRHRSHAAWQVTRRRPGVVLRETGYVEIGPVFAFHAPTFSTLLPFPPLRFGWGLDLHWSALAQEHGWPIGVVDATAVRHGLRRIAAGYDREAAVAEARAFLADRPYTPSAQAQQTLRTYRRW